MKLLYSIICFISIGNTTLAQNPGTPQPGGFQPVWPGGGMQGLPRPNMNGQVQLGATADDIMRQVNRNNPNYGYNSDPASNQRNNEARIRDQLNSDPAYNPSLRNPVRSAPILSRNEAVQKLLREEGIQENYGQNIDRLSKNYYSSPQFAQETKSYTDAFQQLKNMLTGKQKLSLPDAYFAVEYAYGNSYLSQKEFKTIIAESVAFIQQWMGQKGMDIHNSENVHLAIQKFMSEPLTISNSKTVADQRKNFSTTTHKPFFYDFNDNEGEKDFRNYFLTKCLATGSGQCSSMPAVYLCLAQGLGVNAYLTLAPQHSFIKYKDNQSNIINYEPTSNWKMSDKWYQDNMFITAEAKRNGIYLDTLNSKEIVADCMLSLAFGYMKKFGAADAKFVSECIQTADPVFSRPRVQSLFIRSAMLARMLKTVVYAEGITRQEDISKSKEATALYQQLERNEALIKNLGYRDQPKELYNELLKFDEFRGRQQDSLQIDGKRKQNLFIHSH